MAEFILQPSKKKGFLLSKIFNPKKANHTLVYMITINANVNLSDFGGVFDTFVNALIDLDKRLGEAGIPTSVSIPQRATRQSNANGGQDGPLARYYLAWQAKRGKNISTVFSKNGMSIEDSAKYYLTKYAGMNEGQITLIESGILTMDGVNPDEGSQVSSFSEDDAL